MPTSSLEIQTTLYKRKGAIDTMLVSKRISMDLYHFLEEVSFWEFHMSSLDAAVENKQMAWAQGYYNNASESLVKARRLVPNKPLGKELIGFMQMKTDEFRQKYNLQQIVYGGQNAS